jgi:hypothetical protein
MEDVDHKVSLIPDFISNCGMARVCLLYGKKVQMTDEAVFKTLQKSLKMQSRKRTRSAVQKTNISATAFEIALKQLVVPF